MPSDYDRMRNMEEHFGNVLHDKEDEIRKAIKNYFDQHKENDNENEESVKKFEKYFQSKSPAL